jgi:hypothetical protein
VPGPVRVLALGRTISGLEARLERTYNCLEAVREGSHECRAVAELRKVADELLELEQQEDITREEYRSLLVRICEAVA